jgi:predicted metalloprotease with PDZ domain
MESRVMSWTVRGRGDTGESLPSVIQTRRLVCFLILAALLPALAGAQVLYRITPAEDSERLAVEMEFDVSAPTVELRMPSWLPGMYVLQNAWMTLQNVSAVDEMHVPMSVTHPQGDTWIVATGGHKRIRVHYERPVAKARFDSDQAASDADAVHYGSPPVYLYVVGRKEEPCTLELVVPPSWKIAVGLPSVGEIDGHPAYKASNYDMLLDNPVTAGKFLEVRYTVLRKEHIVALRGPGKNWVDPQKTSEMARFVSQIETDFFHGVPYPLYVWHFWVYEGSSLAGGTEHSSSAEMHLSTELGSPVLQGMAHEFFHLWNGKRIRSKVLGPFDYTRLPQTGALWWLEGVTDYYSMLLPFRYGAERRDAFLEVALEQIHAVRDNAARFEVSPYDASYRIPDADGKSFYKVNYYPTGWVLGMLFDIELRVRSKGQHSLDDVELALWDLCKDNRPGFDEGEIRRQLIRFGGADMGALYDQWVLKPGELPVEQELGTIGLEMIEPAKDTNGKAVIQERTDIGSEQQKLLKGWLRSHVSEHIPLPKSPMPPAPVKVDPNFYPAYTGRYELANNVMLLVTSDGHRLLAGFEDHEGWELTPISPDIFFYTERNAQIVFLRDEHREITGILWKENGRERNVPRIGPFIHSLHPDADPNPTLTERVRGVLSALSEGVRLYAETPGLAPGARKDYASSGPVHGLVGIRSLDYVASQNVDGRGIERHGGVVSRIIYYKLTTNKRSEYLMVYLTPDGLVTDFDYVDD